MIRTKTKQIPQRCGVYFFRGKNGEILYIGKAANLKNRIKSYFTGQLANSRLAKLLETADRITWQETSSEIEALILESQLIKKHRPPFNVMLRDDKQYFYVGFSNERFPRVIITHRPAIYSSSQIPNSKFQKKFKLKNWKLARPRPSRGEAGEIGN